MATKTASMTVAQFLELKDPPDGYWELRSGEAVPVTFPKRIHDVREDRLVALLSPLATELGVVSKRVAFRALSEYELRQADVAYVTDDRYLLDLDDYLHGAPDLVIEVLSPSNTAEEMEEKRELCLGNGCQEFWVVSSRAKTVTVYTLDGGHVYKSGDAVPVDRFFPGRAPIPVDEIFANPKIRTGPEA